MIDPNQIEVRTEEEEIYKENILDHFRNPHNQGKLENPTFSHRELNPLCGDVIEIFIKINNEKVEEVKFIGQGCAISQASASMLTDLIKTKTAADLKQLKREDVLNLLKIPIGVVRLKCALLSLKVLQRGIDKHEGKNVKA